jgi:hypothetical protein
MTYSQHIWNEAQNKFVLAVNFRKLHGVYDAGTNTVRLQGNPAVLAAIVLLFETVFGIFPAGKTAHGGILLLKPLKKRQNSIALERQVKLGVDKHIQVKIIAQGTIAIGHIEATLYRNHPKIDPAVSAIRRISPNPSPLLIIR